MNGDIKDLWIDALLSGEYQQGTGQLHTQETDGTDYFCCLGVLTDLAIKNGVPLEIEVQSADTGERRIAYNGCYEYLPRAVAEWAGVPTQGSYKIARSGGNGVDLPALEWTQSLAELNDQGFSFESIAEEIKEYF